MLFFRWLHSLNILVASHRIPLLQLVDRREKPRIHLQAEEDFFLLHFLQGFHLRLMNFPFFILQKLRLPSQLFLKFLLPHLFQESFLLTNENLPWFFKWNLVLIMLSGHVLLYDISTLKDLSNFQMNAEDHQAVHPHRRSFHLLYTILAMALFIHSIVSLFRLLIQYLFVERIPVVGLLSLLMKQHNILLLLFLLQLSMKTPPSQTLVHLVQTQYTKFHLSSSRLPLGFEIYQQL